MSEQAWKSHSVQPRLLYMLYTDEQTSSHPNTVKFAYDSVSVSLSHPRHGPEL